MISDAVEPRPKLPSTPVLPPTAFPASSRPTSLAKPCTGRCRLAMWLLAIERSLVFDVAFSFIGVKFLSWLLFGLLGGWVFWAFPGLMAFHSACQAHSHIESSLMLVPSNLRRTWECLFRARVCSRARSRYWAFSHLGRWLMRSLLSVLISTLTFSWSLLLIIIPLWCFNISSCVEKLVDGVEFPVCLGKRP